MLTRQAVLLASGGLDSTTLAYWLLHSGVSIVPVFVDYGQHSAATEYESLMAVLPTELHKDVQKVVTLGLYNGCDSRMLNEPDLWRDKVKDDDLYVPYRNQLLLTIGAAVAESRGLKQVYSAFIDSNVALGADCTTEFLTQTSNLTSRYGGVELMFPFMGLSKREVAKIGAELGAPIANTYSCLARSRVACGVCPNCVDRNRALADLPAQSSPA